MIYEVQNNRKIFYQHISKVYLLDGAILIGPGAGDAELTIVVSHFAFVNALVRYCQRTLSRGRIVDERTDVAAATWEYNLTMRALAVLVGTFENLTLSRRLFGLAVGL